MWKYQDFQQNECENSLAREQVQSLWLIPSFTTTAEWMDVYCARPLTFLVLLNRGHAALSDRWVNICLPQAGVHQSLGSTCASPLCLFLEWVWAGLSQTLAGWRQQSNPPTVPMGDTKEASSILVWNQWLARIAIGCVNICFFHSI